MKPSCLTKMQLFGACFLVALLCGCATNDLVSKMPSSTSDAGLVTNEPKAVTFEITDTKGFFQLVTTNDTAKSQYETQAEYKNRLQQLHPGDRVFYLETDPKLIDYVYNAETKTLVVMLSWSISRLSLSRQGTLGGSTFVIAGGRWRTSEQQYLINISNFSELPVNVRWKKRNNDYGMESLGLSLPMESADARNIVEGRVQNLILGVVVGDLRRAGRDRLDDAVEMPVTLSEIMVYDSKKKLILASAILATRNKTKLK